MKLMAIMLSLLIITMLAINTFVGVTVASAQYSITLNVRAYIDGRSLLIVRKNLVQWHHLDWAAPGRHEFVNLPTIINGIEWYPQWPDVPDAENRWCNCYSSTYKGLEPALPQRNMTIQLSVIEGRHSVSIAQYPTASNDYTVIIDFDNDPVGGASWYECELTVTVPQVPTMTLWGGVAMTVVLGLLVVYMVRRRHTAS